MESKTVAVEEVRIKVAQELAKRWLDPNQIKGWLKGYKGIPEEAQEELSQVIQALYAEYGLRPDLGHIVILGDRPYVTREGLLYYAHRTGKITGISVELVEKGKGFCIVKATVITEGDKRFEAFGDASVENTNRMVSPHLIRMAETRAINRALREAFPIGLCSYEELSEEDVKGAPQKEPAVNGGSEKGVTQKQLSLIWKLAQEVWPDNKKEEVRELLHKLIEENYGKSSSKELTAKEASDLIDTLKAAKESGI